MGNKKVFFFTVMTVTKGLIYKHVTGGKCLECLVCRDAVD